MNPGDRFRDYILERKIGEGGMGEVWLARHALLGKAVAMKAMADGLASDTKFRERFLGEARAMAVLQHPHIVGATDFFEEGGRLLLVMPFVEGKSLGHRMDSSDGPLSQEEALGVSRDILEALDHAHRRGVIHRDVKPSNILLDGEGRGFLTDFGIALMVGDARKTKTGFSLGTPSYMSPEQIERPKQVDHRADVYSFGCVLFEMLCGRPPFVGDDEDDASDFQIKKGHVMEAPPGPRTLNPSVPAWLEDAVLRSLEKTPERRFQGCGEFARALGNAHAWVSQGGSERFSPSPPRPMPRAVSDVRIIAPERSRVAQHPNDGLEYIRVAAGPFQMGAIDKDDKAYNDERPRHTARITNHFWLCRTPVTVGAFRKFCSESGQPMPAAPAFQREGIMRAREWVHDDHPIVGVTWEAAAAYCAWLGGRLPTEAEWEYACRAGAETMYPWGDYPDGECAWYDENSGGTTHPVRQKKPNAWGIYDMEGNAWEWCADWFQSDYFKKAPAEDPKGPAKGIEKVLRGGSYSIGPCALRCSHRIRCGPRGTAPDYGFRAIAYF